MKERLRIILAVAALLFAILQPALPTISFGMAAPAITPDADCQGGGQCSF